MKTLPVACLVACLAAMSPAQAQQPPDITGSHLLKLCRAVAAAGEGWARDPQAMYCVGTVWGIWQTRALVREYTARQPASWLNDGCAPNVVAPLQLVQITVQYLERHPEAHHLPAAAPAWAGFIEAFDFECSRTR